MALTKDQRQNLEIVSLIVMGLGLSLTILMVSFFGSFQEYQAEFRIFRWVMLSLGATGVYIARFAKKNYDNWVAVGLGIMFLTGIIFKDLYLPYGSQMFSISRILIVGYLIYSIALRNAIK